MQTSDVYKLIQSETDYSYLNSTIHLFIGGSEAHGAKLSSHSDFDLFGVYVPPMEEVIGIHNVAEHFVWSTAGDKKRNGPTDIDMNMYSIRKWARMCTTGNPAALEFLFVNSIAPKKTVWDRFITPNTSSFISSHAGYHFQKFCEHMLRTLKGEGVGKRGQRPDLIAEYGYDTKAAMHLIRVLNEGIELMETGRITLPRPEKDFLIQVRQGAISTLKELEAYTDGLFLKLELARVASKLPPVVNIGEVSTLVSALQEAVWNETNDVLSITAKALSIAIFQITQLHKLHPTAFKEWEDREWVQREIVKMAMEFHEQDKAAAKGK